MFAGLDNLQFIFIRFSVSFLLNLIHECFLQFFLRASFFCFQICKKHQIYVCFFLLSVFFRMTSFFRAVDQINFPFALYPELFENFPKLERLLAFFSLCKRKTYSFFLNRDLSEALVGGAKPGVFVYLANLRVMNLFVSTSSVVSFRVTLITTHSTISVQVFLIF